MFAEIIAIGTELTTGAKLDTNSQWLSQALGQIGIVVRYHQTMADDLAAMVKVFRTAVERSDLVIITGGLGPTQDDLTRQALADLVGVELELNESSLAHLRHLFASRKREMPERNTIQAYFPAGSEPIENARGTAPGIWMKVPRSDRDHHAFVAALPGVPSEMKPMFEHEVRPRLPHSGRVIRHTRINAFGAGESRVEELLGALTARGADPEVGITAHEATITLRIVAEGQTEAECHTKITSVRADVQQRLGSLIFGEEDEELQHVVLRLLQQRGQTLATAEAGNGGLMAHWLTAVNGFESAYLGGVVAPTESAKTTLLGVSPETVGTYGSVSEETAIEMANGCRERFQTDYALALTGRKNDTPEGTVWIAFAGPNRSEAIEHHLIGDPGIATSRAAKTALNLLRTNLVACESPG
ncbi:CinA family nicotinamide mononucleotide deamidase-related protein [Thalassoroseus pseudoceratinae]|uniref:CinA family nicotinamide mononucleotide deamidase-related protein n=1 Tax=Thalassoroseus pseudoceratinae TaxID=2713176 RepID=UPI001422F087|nr:CinA family nicotinamide mononucleotide deamidase-related protein [Thalassoroseus pseudoceratinae]